uniref:Uncharacterized protein n=1 Tax=Trypanosoma vivax (strain Y486) TaxID=1055687 RepID=G0TRZ1_TRYVY|nr:hypothetical protein TVY486_0201280 [Trypanosoma vivax Y486]
MAPYTNVITRFSMRQLPMLPNYPAAMQASSAVIRKGERLVCGGLCCACTSREYQQTRKLNCLLIAVNAHAFMMKGEIHIMLSELFSNDFLFFSFLFFSFLFFFSSLLLLFPLPPFPVFFYRASCSM